MNNLNRSLLDKIAASPTAFHAVDTAAKMLDAAGYLPLDPGNDWALTPGGKYYLTANGSTLIAFRLSAGRPTGFMVSASHSDAPCFKLKPGCERKSGTYVQLNTERYGGTLNNTWFDRPLGIAGRVLAEQDGRIVSRLVAPQQDVAIIPSVAPHLNTEANNGFKVNLNVDTFPLCTMSGGEGALMALVADAAGVDKDAILGHDLYLVCRDRGATVGAKGEFLCSPRIDDLACAFGCLEGFLSADESSAVAVYCLFDNEEVGSATKQGAASALFASTLQRIADSCGCDAAQLFEGSFLISADNAHAIHPNHPEFSDPHNAPVLNGGVVIKYNANQRYTTDGMSAALFTQLCRNAGVSVQRYANRSDLAGGSTLGSIATTKVPIRAVDIGLGQLAMHSCYETMGSADYACLVRAMTAFYSHSLNLRGESWQWM